MNIKFNKIILHNFGSYKHTEVELHDRGFCLVTGKNNCKKDNAISNGSGKSMLWSAICFTLTGETVSGLKSNLKNINVEENACYTSLDMQVDADHFVITRIIAPKSDLKIIKNDIDISGKGIRESEQKLVQSLPELNKELIATAIIVGQGMPNKFSSFSPSGRKDLLERLTKSDFMIADVKSRVERRLTELNEQQRKTDNELLVENTKISGYKNELKKIEDIIAARVIIDYTAKISEVVAESAKLQNDLQIVTNAVNSTNASVETANAELLAENNKKSKKLTEELTDYSTRSTSLQVSVADWKRESKNIAAEIAKLEKVTEFCPTCGQRLPGVYKPDTTEQKKQLENAQAQELKAQQAVNSALAEHNKKVADINLEFNTSIENKQNQVINLKNELQKQQAEANRLTTAINAYNVSYNQLIYARDNEQKYYDDLANRKIEIQSELDKSNHIVDELLLAKTDTQAHIDVVKHIDSYTKRDFRGYLLTNIISYLNEKAKEYSKIVFDTEDLNLYIDGNALEITYCNKFFDSLSGGEKQRIDLILQFAIRELLTNYTNYSANILVLDEIFDNMDKQATDRILQLIADKLKDIESIFIISHHAETLNIGYDSELQIEKNIDGISMIY